MRTAIRWPSKGYDPVAYFTVGKRTGPPEFEYEWDDHRYRFCQCRASRPLQGRAVRYAPQFKLLRDGAQQGRDRRADPENWLISDGKLYVFGKQMDPTSSGKDLAGNVAKANENRPLLPKN